MAKDKKTGLWEAILEGVLKGVRETIVEITEQAKQAAITQEMKGGDAEQVRSNSTTPSAVQKNKGAITYELKTEQVIQSLVTIARATGRTLLEYLEEREDELEKHALELRDGIENDGIFEIREGCLIRYLANDQAFAFVPDGITKIGTEAFAGNETLVSVWMPDTVTKIAPRAFRGCRSLRSVIFSKNLVSLGSSCFENCVMLREVELPPSTRRLGDNTFEGCAGLVRAELPEGLSYLGTRLFAGCKSLESVGWPKLPEHVGNWIFADCATPESRYDRFEKEGTRYVRRRLDAEWLVQEGGGILFSDFPVAQWYIDHLIQDIHAYVLLEYWTADKFSPRWEAFLSIMNLIDVFTGGDPYIIVLVCKQLRTILTDAFWTYDPKKYSEKEILQRLFMETPALIGGNGNNYRHWDLEFQKQVTTLCDGHLREVLDAFSVDPRHQEVDGTESPEPVTLSIRVPLASVQKGKAMADGEADTGEKGEGDVASAGREEGGSEKAGKGGKRRRFQFCPANPDMSVLSEQQEENIVLWLRFLASLGVLPVTQRYNPRIYHYIGLCNMRQLTYWTFVDIIEGLVRGYGIESRRFGADVCEDLPLEEWCRAWSSAIFEENLVIFAVKYCIDEEYVFFAVLEDENSPDFIQVFFDFYGIDVECHLWRNGMDMYKFRVV